MFFVMPDVLYGFFVISDVLYVFIVMPDVARISRILAWLVSRGTPFDTGKC